MLKSLSSRKLPAQQSPLQPNFDWQRLNQLADEDPGFAIELLAMFLKDTESSLRGLERAIAIQSLQAIADTAHTIRGASANVGAISVSTVAIQLEEAAGSGDMTEVTRLLHLLHEQCNKLRAELSAKQIA